MDMNSKLQELVILYVEDEVIIKKILERSLAHKVKHLYLAGNGLEGLELFRQHKPDIVITDINMPVMNGLEMIRHIREVDPAVPIIAATAFSEEDYFSEVIDLEVNAFLIKPVNVQDLLQKIEEIIKPASHGASEKMMVIGPDDEEEYILPLIYQYLRKNTYISRSLTSKKLQQSVSQLEEVFLVVRQLQDDGEILFLDSEYIPVLDVRTNIAPCGRSVEEMENFLRSQALLKNDSAEAI